MDKWIVHCMYKYAICTYNGILFSHKKKENFDTCYNMDEPYGHYANCNKPVTKG